MSLTLIATFNSKEDANHAVDALVETGWDRKTVTTTVRREFAPRPALSPLMVGSTITGTHQNEEADSFKAIGLVALIGAAIGAAIGLMLALGTLGIQFDQFEDNIPAALIAGAIAGLAVGTYSGAVASVRKIREQKFEQLSPYLSTKERVMVSLSVPDEKQVAVAKLLRRHGAVAVREWSVLRNENRKETHRSIHV